MILQKNVPGLSSGGLDRFLLRARRAVGVRGKVNVLVTGRSAIRSLNRDFRKQNKATDVLSFPANSESGRSKMAGEIAICADIARQNATRLGHSPAEEVKILALHGLLHLAGFDHERDNGEMACKEEELRRRLRLPVALIERTTTAAGKSARKSRRSARPMKARGTR